MKIGDLIEYKPPQSSLPRDNHERFPGTVIEFPVASHPKEFQKVRVLTADGIVDWIMQFCEVVSESR